MFDEHHIPSDLEHKDGSDPSILEQIGREVKTLGDNVNALKDSARRDLEAIRRDVEEAKGKLDGEAKQKLDAIAESVLQKLEAAEQKSTARVDDIETRLNRLGFGAAGGGTLDPKAIAEERKSAMEFHRTGLSVRGQLKVGAKLPEPDYEAIKSWNDNFDLYLRSVDSRRVEEKAMSVASDPDGGYLVPTSVSSRIARRIFESSPVRRLATVETTGTADHEVPRDENEAGFGWVGEVTPPTETTTPQLGMAKITVMEMFAEPRITQKMLEDADRDVEGWLINKVADRFGRGEATSFVTGDGILRPRGFLTYPPGTANGQVERVNSGNANLLTADGLIALMFTLKEGYANGASFMMRRRTLREVMQLKDGQNRYLFWQDPTAAAPMSILGSAVEQAADMPLVGAGALAVAYANWKEFYTVVDRLGITVLRDALTAKPYIKFYCRRRVGGDVVNFEAGKFQVISA